MVVGATLRVRIWRMSAAEDDYAGGAVLTGTVVYTGLLARMQADPEELLILQQGMETERTFRMNVWPGNKDIRERDEVEVIFPPTSFYYGKRFRIIGVRASDFEDPRSYMMLSLRHLVRAHTEQ